MRIAYFCDGTWNDTATNTNVCRLYTSTLNIPGEQDCRYDSGVGTDGQHIDRLVGGAFGAGLVDKVKLAYTQIAHLYAAGDDIFLFGFSRGAYTARCIGGMIASCGLPTQNVDDECVDTAWQAYRDKANRATLLATLGNYAMDTAPKIRMLGVWDTVGALGIPALWGGVDTNQYGFLDTGLHPNVQNAFQALALDEQRAQFPATLWTGTFGADQVVRQVWFPGVHCDIGGGYDPAPEDNGARLADASLGWMVDKAVALGLKLDEKFKAKYLLLMNASFGVAQMHDSHTGFFRLAPPKQRPVEAGSVLSNSVVHRCQQISAYRPRNLTLSGMAPANGYGAEAVLNVEAQVVMQMAAAGE